ncbi:MAG: sulfatase, partial [Rhodopirellula sp.]|nr:sulfatase [Rhodopirellula sp.]
MVQRSNDANEDKELEMLREQNGRPETDADSSSHNGSTPINPRQQVESRKRWTRWWEFCLLCVWFGLLLGLTEATLNATYRFHLFSLCLVKSHYRWTAPATYTGLFFLAGIALAVAVGALPEKWRWKLGFRGATLLLAVVYFYQLVDHWDEIFLIGISNLSQLILACGMATTAWRFLARHEEGFFGAVRYGTPVMALVAVGWPSGIYVLESWHARQAATTPAVGPDAPNVLLIVWDTVRAESLSLYGHDQPTTPTLDRLALSGTVFDHAIASAPWTLPSHAGIMTGHAAHVFPSIETRGIPDSFTTLAEVLRDAGYRTGGFVANASFCHRHTGLEQGFEHYDDDDLTLAGVIRRTRLIRNVGKDLLVPLLGDELRRVGRHRSATSINASFLAWHDRQEHRPFFAFLNFMEAHQPYHPPSPFDQTYGPKTKEDVELLCNWAESISHPEKITERQMQVARRAYEGCIAYLDRQLDLLLNELEKRGELDNTLVIVLSDHGEEFGEHGVYTHGTSLYQQQTRVPLIMLMNGRIPQKRRIAETVSLRDVPATVFGLLGIDPSPIPGNSLARFWNPEAALAHRADSAVLSELTPFSRLDLPDVSPAAKGPIRAVWSDKTKYIRRDREAVEELYDLAADPMERNNLAS